MTEIEGIKNKAKYAALKILYWVHPGAIRIRNRMREFLASTADLATARDKLSSIDSDCTDLPINPENLGKEGLSSRILQLDALMMGSHNVGLRAEDCTRAIETMLEFHQRIMGADFASKQERNSIRRLEQAIITAMEAANLYRTELIEWAHIMSETLPDFILRERRSMRSSCNYRLILPQDNLKEKALPD